MTHHFKKLRVLVGCERNGLIRDAFLRAGHDAISCDLKPTTAPGPHYEGDLFDIIDEPFDIGIIHPPCIFVALSSSQWLSHPEDKHLHKSKRRPHPLYPNRKEDQRQAIEFFMRCWHSKLPRLCLENPQPLGELLRAAGPYSQIVNPWQFGDEATKPTCLWLRRLPLLKATKIVGKGEYLTFTSGKKMPKWYADAKHSNKDKTQSLRSITFPGIANAMAAQWGGAFTENLQLF